MLMLKGVKNHFIYTYNSGNLNREKINKKMLILKINKKNHKVFI